MKNTMKKKPLKVIPVDIQKITYDPSKAYQWNGDQEVVISGMDFNLMYSVLSEELQKPEAQEIIQKYILHQRLVNILAREVEEGRFKEKTSE